MTRVVTVLAASILVTVIAGCTTNTAATPTTGSIVPAAAQTAQTVLDVDGVDRSVTIHDVTGESAALVPALILMHGASGSSARVETGTGMTPLADENGFVVAYPNGTPTGLPVGGFSWNAGGCCAAAVADDVDDVAFISTLIDELVADHGVDPARVYIGGFSNGGMMSYRAACEIGDRLAGIVVVGGALNVESCAAPKALPVLIIHGTADTTVPYNGGKPSAAAVAKLGSWVNAPVSDAADYWSTRDECENSETTTEGTVTDLLFSGCTEASGLEVISIAGGTHRWPTVETENFDASSFIVGYFGLAA
jgi:polyhydroxybutyrate depolymerase